jgi:hypothetical protein
MSRKDSKGMFANVLRPARLPLPSRPSRWPRRI